jgi:hypothetical protein
MELVVAITQHMFQDIANMSWGAFILHSYVYAGIGTAALIGCITVAKRYL